jgi:diguanylate cyclase
LKEEIKCKYLSLENVKNVPEEDMKKILDIVKMQLSFMVRNNIAPIPKWYEKWFLIFCYLYENNKQLDDLEIKGLYKTYFSEEEKESKKIQSEIVYQVDKVSEKLEESLEEILKTLDNYQKNLDAHKEVLERKAQEAKDELIISYLRKIMEEIEKLREENLEQKKKLEEYHKEITNLRIELKNARKEADTDFLTELPNRRRFIRALEDFLKDLKIKNYPFSFIILDIDNFKSINDTYGYLVGDEVLKEIANILKFYLRVNTITGRLGGEEFGIILPGVDLESAKNVAERLRKIIENRKIHFDDKVIKVTASFGVTEAKESDTVESLINRADKALYEAKKSGKNKVVVKT